MPKSQVIATRPESVNGQQVTVKVFAPRQPAKDEHPEMVSRDDSHSPYQRMMQKQWR